MEVLTQFILSFIVGLLGLILPIILRAGFKLKFNKRKSAIIMIPISAISIFLLYAVFYFLGFNIKKFSILALSIIAYGTFQILLNENDFESLFSKKTTKENKIEEVKKIKNNFKLGAISTFIKQNWFKITLIIIMLLIYIKLCSLSNALTENNNYIIEKLEKIENSLDGFYSDWFRNL